MSGVRLELQSHAADVQGWLAAKAGVADVQARPERSEVERQLQRRPERAELSQMQDEAARRQAEAAREAREARAELSERAAALERRLESLASEVREGLAAAATKQAVELKLSGKLSAEEVVAQISKSRDEDAAALEAKADAAALHAACEQLEAQLQEAAASWCGPRATPACGTGRATSPVASQRAGAARCAGRRHWAAGSTPRSI